MWTGNKVCSLLYLLMSSHFEKREAAFNVSLSENRLCCRLDLMLKENSKYHKQLSKTVACTQKICQCALIWEWNYWLYYSKYKIITNRTNSKCYQSNSSWILGFGYSSELPENWAFINEIFSWLVFNLCTNHIIF